MKTLRFSIKNFIQVEWKPIIHSIIPYILLFTLSNINLFLGVMSSFLYWVFIFYVYFEIKKIQPSSIIFSFIFFIMLISGI